MLVFCFLFYALIPVSEYYKGSSLAVFSQGHSLEDAAIHLLLWFLFVEEEVNARKCCSNIFRSWILYFENIMKALDSLGRKYTHICTYNISKIFPFGLRTSESVYKAHQT
jgi:hypothetical protein